MNLKHYVNAVKLAYIRWNNTPRNIKPWQIWGIRRILSPYFGLHCWLVSKDGTKFHLGDDRVDDRILEDVLTELNNIYLPEVVSNLDIRCILDVGSHHGIVTTRYAKLFPNAEIIAVEPDRDSIAAINLNLSANNLLARVKIHNVAIGESATVTRLYVGKESWATSTFPFESAASITEVESQTLENILGERIPQLVKCNAEGAEYTLVPQLLTLKELPRYLIIMVHPEHGDPDRLISSIESKGYKIKDFTRYSARPIFHFSLLP